ncbi:MAG TPA: contractile injection system tape measure protein, partial [Chryseolinea sp.]
MIHRILFDVGCRAEDAVRSIQHTIQHYTLPRVEKATESLFQKFGKDHGHIIIDKVELDLGEFSLTDLEGDCFADAFEYKFAECLEAAGRKYQVGEQAKWNPAKTNWEILKAFLLEGDLPWWINKREALNLRRILMLVLHSEPGQVESFLAQQSDEVARERLWLLLANKDKDRFTYLFKNPDQKRYDFPGLSLMALFSILKEPFHQVMLQEKQAWQKFLQSVNTKYSPR